MTESTQKELISLPAQPFPELSWWQQFLYFEEIKLDSGEVYKKTSPRNRYYVTGPQGSQRLSLPLKGGRNQRKKIKAIEIDFKENWPVKHWRTLKSLYGRAPFFEFYAPELEAFFTQETQDKIQNLFDWNLETILLTAELLQLKIDLKQKNNIYLLHVDNPYRRLHHDLKANEEFQIKAITYHQVFMGQNGFIPNLSILDLLMCMGSESVEKLAKMS